MSTTRIINVVLVAVALVALAWAVSLVSVQKPSQSVEHVLPAALSRDGDYVYTEGDKYYSIEAHYPAKTALAGAADALARRSIELGVLAEVQGFQQILAQSLTTEEKARLDESGGAAYAFVAQYQEFPSAHYDSFLYLLYQDTGGAHPNGYFKTFVFDQRGEPVALGDLFAAGSDYLGRLAEAATASVRQQLSERLGSDAAASMFTDGLTPTLQNFQNFTLDDEALHIYFPPYQVAAYAAGTFDVAIPLSSLVDILRPGVR